MGRGAAANAQEEANGVRGGKGPAALNLAERLREARAKAAPAAPSLAPVVLVPWEAIDPSPLNPRKVFAAEQLAELAENIRSVGGVKQNVLVRPRDDAPGRYWLIAGERRHRAVGLLVEQGIAPLDFPIPARVEHCDDVGHLKLSMIENLQRADMNPMEEAEGYAALIAQGMSPGAIAREILGHPERTRYVQLRVNLVHQLAPEAQEALRAGRISVEQARVLKIAPPEQQGVHLGGLLEGHYRYRTTADLRNCVREQFVPVSRYPHLRAAYESRDGALVAEEEGSEPELYGDPALIRALRDEEIERLRADLADVFPWVQLVGHGQRTQYFNAYDYETRKGHEQAGAVVEIGYDGPLKVHRHLVPKKVLLNEALPPGEKTGEPWTKAHLAHAKRRKSLALRTAVGKDVDAAKRLVCLALLGATTCVDLSAGHTRGQEDKGALPPDLVEAVESFARVKVNEHGQAWPAKPHDPLTHTSLWVGLARLQGGALDCLFSALVALRVGTFNGYNEQPGDEPVAVEIARSLGLVGNEEQHGLGLEPDDLDGLRKPGLEACARLGGVRVEGDATTKGLREALAGVAPAIRHAFVFPTLRFGTKAEVLRSLGEGQG